MSTTLSEREIFIQSEWGIKMNRELGEKKERNEIAWKTNKCIWSNNESEILDKHKNQARPIKRPVS
jgi:hypothetical protein